MWSLWKYALGSFSDDTTKPYDNKIAIIRSLWVSIHLITCSFIIMGNGRALGLW